ncbi:serine/threonine-protein kinase [Streptomyces sp. NPDC048650]|uniref:serine/threonine-protein kinase n=1 Tax=unclassified Streptomyces TaxID=2593676 RepID=UPI003711D916
MTGTGIRPLGDDPQQIGGYRLLGRLGVGGMGRIYLARSTADGSLAAVKTLLAEGVVTEADRRRFTREVKLARRVDSAYTARVLDADPKAERPWMAIEYIPAPPLSDLVRRAGRLPGAAVRWIAAGTAKALVALHDVDIVHRDVKPQNILLPLAGPRLIDFGISHANDITRTSLTLGTIAFTSPEQARAEPSTTASDVYSLGATLFHLAVGRPPYPETDDTIRLLTLVQRGALDLTGLPAELAPLIRPCLSSEPDLRPEPADVLGQFLAELDRTPASQRGEHWLPPRWTALIEEYEEQGRALLADDAPTIDARTRQVPPPKRTRVATEERAAHRKKEQQRARAEGDRRAAENRRKAEARERKAAAEKTEKERREREERKRRDRAERARKEQDPKAKSSTPSTPSTSSTPSTPSTSSSDGGVWVLLVLVAVVLFVWRPWDEADTTGSTSGATSSSTSAGTYTSGGTGTAPTTDTYTSGGTGASSTSGSSTGGSSTSGSSTSGSSTSGATVAAPTTAASRTLSPVDEAFAAVRSGDCLDAYQDGYGSWSRTTPVEVGCGAANAYLRVDSVATSGTCPSGGGRGGWWHAAADFSSTNLCVERQFRNGQCFLAKSSGGRPGGANLLTLWNCSATRVPREFSYVMQITAVLPASSGTRACPSEPGRYSYSWNVYDGGTMICAKVA